MRTAAIGFIVIAFVAGISSHYQGTFWHICDLHLNMSSNVSYDNQFGNYKSDSTWSLLKSAIDEMVRIHWNPDFIIVNGDNARHSLMNDTDFQNTVNEITKSLFLQFPNTTFLPSLGNHDVNPANLFNETSNYCEKYYEFWKDFFQHTDSSDIEDFKRGCFYTQTIKSFNGSIRIIVLNTLLWYTSNTLAANLDDPLGQFTWFMKKLDQARRNESKVFIVSHVPPGASEYSPQIYRNFHARFNQRFLQIILNYSDIIDAGFFAHQHTDAFKIAYDSNGIPRIPLLLAPSITPYHLWNLGAPNPSIRLYKWGGTASTSRYLQYHTSLDNIQNNTLNWSLEYESTSMLPGLSSEQLDNLVLDFEQENSRYFSSFFSHHLSGRPHDGDPQCSAGTVCRCRIICGSRNIDYTHLDECLHQCDFLVTLKIIWIVSIVLVIVILIIVVCLILIKFRRDKFRSRRHYHLLT